MFLFLSFGNNDSVVFISVDKYVTFYFPPWVAFIEVPLGFFQDKSIVWQDPGHLEAYSLQPQSAILSALPGG